MELSSGTEQSVIDTHLPELKKRLAEACTTLGELCERHAVVAQAWKGRLIAAPDNVTTTPNGSGSVLVCFDLVPGASSYVVRWNRVVGEGSPGDPYGGVLVFEEAPAAITGLLNETLYTFSCAAVTETAGEGPSSLPVGCTPTAMLPEAPRAMSVSSSASRIAMIRFREPRGARQAMGDTVIQEYTVQWSGASAPYSWSEQGGEPSPSNILGLPRKGQVSATGSPIMVELPMSGEFRFVCRARNAHGYGAESEHVIVTVPPARSPMVSPVSPPPVAGAGVDHQAGVHGDWEEGMLGSFPI